MKTTHKCIVFKLKEFLTHYNADNLKIVKIADTDYYYCANYEEWKGSEGQLVCWIPPENLVNTKRTEFAWLAKDAKYNSDSTKNKTGDYALIKGRKIREVMSYGILVKAPNHANIGDDLSEYFGVIHFDEEKFLEVDQKIKGIKVTMGENCSPPNVFVPYYDVDSLLSLGKKVFEENEEVVVNLKIEGSNGAFVFHNNEFWCRSRNFWKKEFPSKPKIDEENLRNKKVSEEEINFIKEKLANWNPKRSMWWEALNNEPQIKNFLMNNPDYILFAEVYGHVKGFNYNTGSKIKLLAFDIMKDGRFLDYDEAKNIASNVPWTPELYRGPYNLEKMHEITNNLSGFSGGPLEEGIVIRSVKESLTKWGRKVLKLKNPKYIEKKG